MCERKAGTFAWVTTTSSTNSVRRRTEGLHCYTSLTVAVPGKLANSAAMSSSTSDRDRVACIFSAYNASQEVAKKTLEALAAKDDFHVGITLVFMKSRKATAYLQVRNQAVGCFLWGIFGFLIVEYII